MRTPGCKKSSLPLKSPSSSSNRLGTWPLNANSAVATLPSSWFEIHADNTILIRTGKVDFGQSTAHTAYKQIVAEELNVAFEAITTVIMGDTDRTPDGGFSAGYLAYGGANLRKAAAYTYQALLELAASTLGVEKSELSVKGGVVSGGGGTMSYGELVQGQDLKLAIPVSGDLTSMYGLTVTGNPPVKPTSEYTVIGRSYASTVTPSKVAAKEVWVTDVRLPNMLHGRVIHPKTLGSTLISVGTLDKASFPNTQVVVKGNLVGVVAPTEWEAIKAARQIAADTKWTEWKGLPGHAGLYNWMRKQADWEATPVSKSDKSRGNVGPALASAAKSLSASYELPFMKHAPIGPIVEMIHQFGNAARKGPQYLAPIEAGRVRASAHRQFGPTVERDLGQRGEKEKIAKLVPIYDQGFKPLLKTTGTRLALVFRPQ